MINDRDQANGRVPRRGSRARPAGLRAAATAAVSVPLALASLVVPAAAATTSGTTTGTTSAAAPGDGTSSLPTPIVCAPIIVYGTRGSGIEVSEHDSGAGKEVGAVVDALEAARPGQVRAYYNNYPAVDFLPEYVTQNWQPYWDSVFAGAALGRQDLEDLAEACPNSTFVVAGHSQGADVTRRLFTPAPAGLNPARTKIYLFGDVNFRWDEAGIAKSGKYNKQNGLVPSGLAAGVTIPQPIPAISASWHAESWCHEADAACQTIGSGGEPHNNYGALDGKAAAWRASQFAGGTAAAATPVARFGNVSCPSGTIPNVVDVTVSMAGSAAGSTSTVRGFWDGNATPAFHVTLTAGQTSTQQLTLPFNLWQPQLEVVSGSGSSAVRLEQKFVYPVC